MTDLHLPPPQPAGAPPTAPRPPRGLQIALAVSLALNLAVAGLAIGTAVHGGPGPRGDLIRDMGFGPFDAALRPEDRDALKKSAQQRAGDLRTARREMQGDSTAILTALRSDPFDPAALNAAFATQQQHLADRIGFGSGLIRDFLLALPQKERLEFADRLEDHMKRGPRAGKDAAPKPGN